VSLRSADPRSGKIGGGGERRAPGCRRVDMAGDWSAGEGELKNEEDKEKVRTRSVKHGGYKDLPHCLWLSA
jgi:hypothetical protein